VGSEYTWDNNGNLLNDGVRQFAYDAANRLTSVAEGADLTSFAYNGDGARVGKTVDGATTSYVLDVNSPLPVVLVERPGQTDQTNYVYGLSLLADWTGGTGSTWRYYHADRLGSTRHLTNAQG
jgi:YD repeat-containing protein